VAGIRVILLSRVFELTLMISYRTLIVPCDLLSSSVNIPTFWKSSGQIALISFIADDIELTFVLLVRLVDRAILHLGPVPRATVSWVSLLPSDTTD